MTTATYRIVLGLDLGVGSVGWALVRERLEDGGWSPESLSDIGVRVFEKGMEEDQAGMIWASEPSPDRSRAGMRPIVKPKVRGAIGPRYLDQNFAANGKEKAPMDYSTMATRYCAASQPDPWWEPGYIHH